MVRPTIEFCISNLAEGTQKAREALEKDANLDIVEYGCLSNCGKCYHSFYALVNGKVIMGESAENLVENIYEFLDEHHVF